MSERRTKDWQPSISVLPSSSEHAHKAVPTIRTRRLHNLTIPDLLPGELPARAVEATTDKQKSSMGTQFLKYIC